MKYKVTFIIVVTVVAALLLAGHTFVPKVAGDKNTFFSDEFLFNAYLLVLGFFLTSALAGPIVALFLDWRTSNEWRAARCNARDRITQTLVRFIDDYNAFLCAVKNDALDNNLQIFLDSTLLALADFFDIYTTENVTFNAGMHSAVSSIRSSLLPLHRSLVITKLSVNRTRSYRAYLHPDALNKLREIVDKEPLTDACSIARNPYFARHGKLFIDLQIDTQLGAGMITLHRFSPINVGHVQAQLSQFCDSCKTPGGVIKKITQKEFIWDEDTQARLHAKFVRSQVNEDYLGKLLVKDGYWE